MYPAKASELKTQTLTKTNEGLGIDLASLASLAAIGPTSEVVISPSWVGISPFWLKYVRPNLVLVKCTLQPLASLRETHKKNNTN